MASERRMELSNGRVSLELNPEFGARITKLADLETGRHWLTEGECEGDPSDEAEYLGEQARGWDECFPTISTCEVDHWGELRDHGLLWGRPWEAKQTDDAIDARHVDERFTFRRRLRLDGKAVVAEYAVANTSDRAFSYIWSQHCLLEIRAGEVISVPGKAFDYRISQVSHFGKKISASGLEWPVHGPTGLDLSKAMSKSERFHAKIHGFAGTAHDPSDSRLEASASGPRGGIRFIWDRGSAPGLGLWLNYGAWPNNDPGQQIAIEPTTASTDCLDEAAKLDRACMLNAGEVSAWSVRVELAAD